MQSVTSRLSISQSDPAQRSDIRNPAWPKKIKRKLGSPPLPSIKSAQDPITKDIGLTSCAAQKDPNPPKPSNRANLLGSTLGAYRLTKTLGKGGVGTVYLGERADRQYSAQVAVKVIENRRIDEEAVSRFQAERQILAQLNHPNIARLLDAGESRQGLPYLVMEYVHGESIDQFCNSMKLTIKERLQLFTKVCTAVQYAHQNLIVHRDLKPGNIIVTPDGTPKLLDFGIAKLVDDRVKSSASVTEIGITCTNERLLTPEYASPEQIIGQTITTASDIYALGMILYELLTGTRPYHAHGLSQLELERIICITDPTRPSQIIEQPNLTNSKLESYNLEEAARTRSISAKRLKKELSGDLDAIIMRTLRKEPAQRYSSVEQLIDDINRHINQEPVDALQGNWVYYSKRFVCRHIIGVITGAIAVITLIGFSVFVSIQNKTITEQRDLATQQTNRAEHVSDFMLEVFSNADPFINQGKEVSAQQLLEKAGKNISDNNTLNQQPAVKAKLLEAIGRSYQQQNQPEQAIKYLTDSVLIQRINPENSRDALAKTLNYLGDAQRQNGLYTQSEASLNEAQSIIESQNQYKTPAYIDILKDIARLELTRSNPAKANQTLEKALSLAKQIYGDTHPEIATIYTTMTETLLWLNKEDEALNAARKAMNISHLTLPETHPDRAYADFTLGDLLYRVGQFEEASALVNQSLKAQIILYGETNPVLASTLDALSLIQQAEGKIDEAELNARKALTITENALGKNNINAAYFHTALADVLTKRNKHLEAKGHAQTAMNILAKNNATDHQYMASAEYLLAQTLLSTNQPKQAEQLLHKNIARWKENGAPEWRVARSENLLGAVLVALNKKHEGEKLLHSSFLFLQSKSSGASPQVISEAKARMALTYFGH